MVSMMTMMMVMMMMMEKVIKVTKVTSWQDIGKTYGLCMDGRAADLSMCRRATDTCRKSGSGRAAGIGPCFDLSTTHTYGSNHSWAVVRADFAWTDGRPVYRCVDGRQIHAESRVGRPAEIGPCFDLSETHTYGSGRYE